MKRQETCSISFPTSPYKNCDVPLPPVVDIEAQRKASILNDTAAIFSISNNPQANSNYGAWREIPRFAYTEISEHDALIEQESISQGVDPNLVKAIVYIEASHGGYGYIAENIGIADSFFPMNIRASIWGDILTSQEKGGLSNEESFQVPALNVRAGVRLIKRIQDRIQNPTVRKISTLYNSLSQESVTDYGARSENIYTNQLWLQTQCADRLHFTPPDNSHLLPSSQDKQDAFALLQAGQPSYESPFLKTNDCTETSADTTCDFYITDTSTPQHVSLTPIEMNLVSGSIVSLSDEDDHVISNGGRNIIDGRGGIDTVSYENAKAGVDADLAAGSVIVGNELASDGALKNIDTIANVENVIGSSYGDRLVASQNTTALEGGPGPDELEDPYPDHATEYRFNQGHGLDIVRDDDRQGSLVYEGQKVEGTLAAAYNNVSVFYLDIGKHTAVFTRVTITGNNNGTVNIQGTDAVMTIDRTLDSQTKDAVSITGFDPLISSFGIKVESSHYCQHLYAGSSNPDICHLVPNGRAVISHTIRPLDVVYKDSPKAPTHTFLQGGLYTEDNIYAYISNLNVQFYLWKHNDTAICGALQPNYNIPLVDNHFVYNRQCTVDTGEGDDIVKITYNPYHPYSFDFVLVNDFDNYHDRIDLTEYRNIRSFSDVKPYNNAGFEGATFLLEERTILRFPNIPPSYLRSRNFILRGSGETLPPFPDQILGDNTDERIVATKPGSYYNGLGGADEMRAEIATKGAPTTVRGGADEDSFTVVMPNGGTFARRDAVTQEAPRLRHTKNNVKREKPSPREREKFQRTMREFETIVQEAQEGKQHSSEEIQARLNGEKAESRRESRRNLKRWTEALEAEEPVDEQEAQKAMFLQEPETREEQQARQSWWGRLTTRVTSSWRGFWDEVAADDAYDREVETDGKWLDGSDDFPEDTTPARRAISERDDSAQELILSDFDPEIINGTDSGSLGNGTEAEGVRARETVTLEGYRKHFGGNVNNVPVTARDNGTELQVPGYNIYFPHVAPGQFNPSVHLQLTDGAGSGDGDGSPDAGTVAGAVVGTVVPVVGMVVLATVAGVVAYKYRHSIKSAASTSASWVAGRYHYAIGHEAPEQDDKDQARVEEIEMEVVGNGNSAAQDMEEGVGGVDEAPLAPQAGAALPVILPQPPQQPPQAGVSTPLPYRRGIPLPVPPVGIPSSREPLRDEEELEGNSSDREWEGKEKEKEKGEEPRKVLPFAARIGRPAVPTRALPSVPTFNLGDEKEVAGAGGRASASDARSVGFTARLQDGIHQEKMEGNSTVISFPTSSSSGGSSLRVRDVIGAFLGSAYATHNVYKDPAAQSKIMQILRDNVLKTEKLPVTVAMAGIGDGEGQIAEAQIVDAIFRYAVSTGLQQAGKTAGEEGVSGVQKEKMARVYNGIKEAVHSLVSTPPQRMAV